MTNAAPPRLLPFDHLDKVCFVAQNLELGVSFAPVWQLSISGDFDADVARQVIDVLIRRYPVLSSRVVSADDNKSVAATRKLAYRVERGVTSAELFTVVDLRDASAADYQRFQQETFNHQLDPVKSYPLRLIWAPTGADNGTLFLQQHHAIADGKAFFSLLEEFCSLYDRSASGKPLEALAEIPRLSEAEVAEPRRWRRLLHRYLGYWMYLRAGVIGIFRPMSQLSSNLSRDYSGNNSVTHAYVDTAVIDKLRSLRSATGCSVNDFLSTALALTLHRWSSARGHVPKRFTILIPADARPRDWQGESFANHLCSYAVCVHARLVDQPGELLRDLHRQIGRQFRRRYHIKALLAGIRMARLFSVAALTKIIYGAKKTALNFSFSNLIPISPTTNGGRFATRDWTADKLEIMTPCGFLQGVNTTVIRYADKICFNFNFKDSCVDADSVDELIEGFRQTIDELIAAAEPR